MMADKLTIMPSNNTGSVVRELARRFPGRLAHLISPEGWRTPFLPYALDNGAFTAFSRGTAFDEDAFLTLCDRAKAFQQTGGTRPLWVAVPDVVADAARTIQSWKRWSEEMKRYDWPLAFVVQDGMSRQDVPTGADIIFVGGSLEWKWSTVPSWSAWFRHVHVGRVNSPSALEYLEALGVESCDGTGWLRGDPRQLRGLQDFLAGKTNLRLFDPSELSLPNASLACSCKELDE